MTRGFDERGLLGEGGFGPVYKGSLRTRGGRNLPVAVKELERGGHQVGRSILEPLLVHSLLLIHPALSSLVLQPAPAALLTRGKTLTRLFTSPLFPILLPPVQGEKEWLTEVSFLGLLAHPNLVSLIGYCAEGQHRHLVYEFAPNGSLEFKLFSLEDHEQPLSWHQRLRIAYGAARGLAYLHEEAEHPVRGILLCSSLFCCMTTGFEERFLPPASWCLCIVLSTSSVAETVTFICISYAAIHRDLQVIYRDFKTSNILLTSSMEAKLSDFGLARSGPDPEHTHVSTRVRGRARPLGHSSDLK